MTSVHRKSYYSWAQRYALYPVCVHIREYFFHDLKGSIDIGIDFFAVICHEKATVYTASLVIKRFRRSFPIQE